MTVDISGFKLQIQVVASITFPLGFTLTQFADDADPFDIPSLQIADSAMGLNGDLIRWAKANPIKPVINVIPNSQDDLTLSILFEANRVGRNKLGAQDVITMVASYSDGRIVTYTDGVITDGIAGLAVASSGRMKSKAYQFAFENRIGV